MLYTTILTTALAGLAVASPAARPDQSSNHGLQQRVSSLPLVLPTHSPSVDMTTC